MARGVAMRVEGELPERADETVVESSRFLESEKRGTMGVGDVADDALGGGSLFCADTVYCGGFLPDEERGVG